MYKIMYSDLDETLLVNHHVPDFNVEAIKKAQEKGLKFVPCTGRACNMIPEILKEIGTYDQENEYAICFNGGLVVENKNQKILYFKGLDYENCSKIFDYGKELDVCVLVFTIDCCYIFHADKREVERKIEQKAPFKVIDTYDMSFLKNENIAKILYAKRDMDRLKDIVETMPEVIKKDVNITYSSNRYIEFNTKGVNKGTGMRFLTDYLGFNINQTIGIGDNYNDVEMIKTAGLGCVVACASDDVKALAQYVTVHDYDQGAVKEVIEKYILEEE